MDFSKAMRRILLGSAVLAAAAWGAVPKSASGIAVAPPVYPILGAVDDGVVVAWTSGPSGQTVIRAERLDK